MTEDIIFHPMPDQGVRGRFKWIHFGPDFKKAVVLFRRTLVCAVRGHKTTAKNLPSAKRQFGTGMSAEVLFYCKHCATRFGTTEGAPYGGRPLSKSFIDELWEAYGILEDQ